MQALTWSPDLYGAVKSIKQHDAVDSRKAILSVFNFSAQERKSAIQVLVDKKVAVSSTPEWY
jgi:hypothetical protein